MVGHVPRILVLGQIGLTAVTLVVATLWPPVSGRMLLIPLTGADRNATTVVALAGGARLVGAGPLPGSMVIVGDRARIMRQGQRGRFAAMAAPPAGCGDPGPIGTAV